MTPTRAAEAEETAGREKTEQSRSARARRAARLLAAVRVTAVATFVALLLAPVVGPWLTSSQWLAIEGGSMRPAVDYGDLVMVRATDSVEVGDIVTVGRDDGSLVTHRVVDVGPDELVLHGDANEVRDPHPVPADDLHGRVEAVIGSPWSTALRAANEPVGRITLVGAVLLLVFTAPRPGRSRPAGQSDLDIGSRPAARVAGGADRRADS